MFVFLFWNKVNRTHPKIQLILHQGVKLPIIINYQHYLYFLLELYMISDNSHDFEGTWSFLDRRMSDIGMMISAKETVRYSMVQQFIFSISRIE